jgi:hypothetical protein
VLAADTPFLLAAFSLRFRFETHAFHAHVIYFDMLDIVEQGAVKIMAKDLIRTRHQITKFYALKSQLQGVSLRIQVTTRMFYICFKTCNLVTTHYNVLIVEVHEPPSVLTSRMSCVQFTDFEINTSNG